MNCDHYWVGGKCGNCGIEYNELVSTCQHQWSFGICLGCGILYSIWVQKELARLRAELDALTTTSKAVIAGLEDDLRTARHECNMARRGPEEK